jgi:osmotically-inducible protein OsmY
MLFAAGCAPTSTSEGTGGYFDDSVITTKVKTAIFNDSSLHVTQINVETYKGEVQLSGFVSTTAEIDKAGSVAKGVAGVKSVTNDLKVK